MRDITYQSMTYTDLDMKKAGNTVTHFLKL